MRRATWAPLGGMGARLRRLVLRLSTLRVMSFAVAETGVLESKETRAWVGVAASLRESSEAGEGECEECQCKDAFGHWRSFLLLD